MKTTSDLDAAPLPRLALESPEALDRAVVQAFWTLEALVGAVADGDEDSRPSPAERARRRAVMRKLAEGLGASVCTSKEGAPRPVQRRAR